MTDADFARRLREAYKEEASEILADVGKAFSRLAALSENTIAEQLPYINRSLSQLHSLKGSARAVGEAQAVTICQWLETALAEAKSKSIQIDHDKSYKLSFSLELLDEVVARESDEEDQEFPNRIKAEVKKLLSDYLEKDLDSIFDQEEPNQANTYEMFGQEVKLANPVFDNNLTSVRVPIEKLDRLLSESEELISIKTRASEYFQELSSLKSMIADLIYQIGMNTDVDPQLLNQANIVQSKLNVMTRGAARDRNSASILVNRYLEMAKTLVMLPVSTTFEGFPRLIRELNRELDKDVELSIEGGELEVDRRVLERLKDPLVHLLRNAMDHGIESSSVRSSALKGRGKLHVAARQLNGETIEISIEDNGRGIDTEAVRKTAIRRQLLNSEEAHTLGVEEIHALIFRSDFSTRETVSELSGRGLGLAIVKEKIEELNGRLELNSTSNGTTFRIVLPTTLATFMGILVESSAQRFVVPLAGLSRAIRVHPLALEVVDERETFMVDGQVIPVASLSKALNLASLPVKQTQNRGFKYLEMLVISHRDKKVGVIVDQILTEQEFLVKKLGYPLGQINNFAGATILSDSKVALVINLAQLADTIIKTRFMQDQKPMFGLAAMLDREEHNEAPSSILVVEDSLTSRIFMRNILESAGYRVTLSVNGQDALTKLNQENYDLVLSDVEMPLTNGLELTRAIRSNAKWKQLPVVLVTSLGSQSQISEGMSAGANAYFVKGDLDQADLLSVIKGLL